MNDDLSRIPFMIELSRKLRTIIAINIAASVVIALAGLGLAATGRLDIYGALVFHFIGDVFVIANSFRLFRFGEGYASVESETTDDLPQRRAASMTLGQASPA
jgi:cation transport ATPase